MINQTFYGVQSVRDPVTHGFQLIEVVLDEESIPERG